MKKIYAAIIMVAIVAVGYFYLIKKDNWQTYTNIDPAFSFDYPKSWGKPDEVYKNDLKDEFEIAFRNCLFCINNGYPWKNEQRIRMTVAEHLELYKTGVNGESETKDFQVTNIEVDHHPAVKVSSDDFGNEHFTDIYIYIDEKKDKFILVSAVRSFVDDITFNKILSTFKFGI